MIRRTGGFFWLVQACMVAASHRSRSVHAH